MKARLQVIRTNAAESISKEEQNSVYRIGTCKHTNARKALTKVLSSKYRGVFAKLSWVNNEDYNVKTALLKSGEILTLLVTPASDEAVVTFAEAARKASGEKMAFVVEKQRRDGEVLETNEFTAPNERVARGTINKDAKYANYKDGNWTSLPFNKGSFKESANGQTVIVLKSLGKAENTDNE